MRLKIQMKTYQQLLRIKCSKPHWNVLWEACDCVVSVDRNMYTVYLSHDKWPNTKIHYNSTPQWTVNWNGSVTVTINHYSAPKLTSVVSHICNLQASGRWRVKHCIVIFLSIGCQSLLRLILRIDSRHTWSGMSVFVMPSDCLDPQAFRTDFLLFHNQIWKLKVIMICCCLPKSPSEAISVHIFKKH